MYMTSAVIIGWRYLWHFLFEVLLVAHISNNCAPLTILAFTLGLERPKETDFCASKFEFKTFWNVAYKLIGNVCEDIFLNE